MSSTETQVLINKYEYYAHFLILIFCLFHHRGLECKSRKSRDNWDFGLGVQKEGGQG